MNTEVSVPGPFKMDHLQLFKPILLWNFSNFFTFILGSPFLLPQRRGLIMEKGNSHNSRNGWDWGVLVPGAIKLDHLQPFKPLLFWNFSNFFTFILGSPFLLPQRANFGSWENFPPPNMDETEGFECLGHSNWTICSPLSHFCSEIFPTFSLSYWGAHSYYPRGLIMRKGNSPNSRNGWDRGVSVPGAFKLDHLQPFKPILFWKISNFFTFILGSPFLLPQRANYEKGEFSQLKKWMRQRGFSAWGLQTGSFAAL